MIYELRVRNILERIQTYWEHWKDHLIRVPQGQLSRQAMLYITQRQRVVGWSRKLWEDSWSLNRLHESHKTRRKIITDQILFAFVSSLHDAECLCLNYWILLYRSDLVFYIVTSILYSAGFCTLLITYTHIINNPFSAI